MNKLIPGIALLLLFALTSSCKIFRPTSAGTTKLPNRSARFLMKKLVQQQVEFEWFSAKARLSFSGEDLSISVSSNLRMQKDSLIWANARKLSIEAGRVLIRPDSFFVIDRINRQYAKQPVSAIAETLQLPANFEVMQTLLLGNPVFFTTDLQAGIEGAYYTLSGENDRFATTYHIDGNDYALRKISVLEKKENREVLMELSDYKTLDRKQNFSYIRTLWVDSPDTGPMHIDIEFSKVELNVPKNIQFEIPSRYTEID